MNDAYLVADGLRAAPGEMTHGFVVVDESASGVLVRVPTILINGSQPGPTLMVASGIHGDDLNTIPMIWRVATEVSPHELCGKVIAVPVCNPLAFEAGAHRTPADHKTPSFPGSLQGSVSERIGYHLYHKLVGQADYVLDMHGGSLGSTLAVLAMVDKGAEDDVVEESRLMAEAFGPDLIVMSAPKPGQPPRGMVQVAGREGKPGVMIGMGQMGFNEDDTLRGSQGVINVMRHVGMLGDVPKVQAPPRYTSSSVYQYTPLGGTFFPEASAGQEVATGQVVGVVRDVFGEQIGEIESEIDGVVEAIRFYPVIAAGDWVVTVAGF